MIRQLMKYFNIMSELIRDVLNYGVFSDRDFRSMLGDPNNPILLELATEFPQLMDSNQKPHSVTLGTLNNDFFQKTSSFIASHNVYSKLLLLYYMDYSIEECYIRNLSYEDDVEHFEALNGNVVTTQIVLAKRTRCCWEHSSHDGDLNGILYNFYFIDICKLPNTRIIQHSVDYNLTAPKSCSVYQFALSPITKQKSLCLSQAYQKVNPNTGALQYLFRVEGLLNEKDIKQQVLNNILNAGRAGTDVLVFPEMLGSAGMLQEILVELKSLNQIIPTLIVFPSIWEKSSDNEINVNKSCMVFNGSDILFEQKKYCNFNYSENGHLVYEDINGFKNEQTVLHLLHIKGLGRICIIICYDYLETQNRDRIIKNLRPTLICSPSFSTGSFNFRILSEAYLDQSCNWIWCNTCSAVNHTDKINNFEISGIITTLSKQCDFSKSDGLHKVFDGVKNCAKENCDNCIYYAEISSDYPKNIVKGR